MHYLSFLCYKHTQASKLEFASVSQTLMKYAIKLKFIEFIREREANSPGICNNCNFICFTPNREGEKAHRASEQTRERNNILCLSCEYDIVELVITLPGDCSLHFQVFPFNFQKPPIYKIYSCTVSNYSPSKCFTL